MRKLILLSVCALSLASCGNSTKNDDSAKKTDAQQMELKEKVKSFTEFYVTVKDGELKKGNKKQSWIFDEQGTLIQREKYNYNGELNNKWTFTHDANGNLTEKINYSASDSILSKWIIKNDENGNPLEEIVFITDDSIDCKYTFVYDEAGNKIEEATFNGDSSLYSKITYKYNERNLMTEMCEYNEDDMLITKWVYEYDKDDNKSVTSNYSFDGELYKRWTYKYDKQEHKMKEVDMFNQNGELNSKITFIYDMEGNVTEKTYYNPDGTVQIKWNTKYDSKRNRTVFSEFYAANLTLEKGQMHDIDYYEEKL